VLNVQLEAGAETYRDHYIDLDFVGEKTIVLGEPTSERMLPEFRPAHANYRFKAACYHFNYRQIVALNFRWMRLPVERPVRCQVSLVEALAESEATLKNPEIVSGGSRFVVPVELNTGDYAEYWADGPLRVFDRNGVLLETIKPPDKTPLVPAGRGKLQLGGPTPGMIKVTLITPGEPLRP